MQRFCSLLGAAALVIVKADVFDDAVVNFMEEENILGASVAFYKVSDPNNIGNFARGYGSVGGDSNLPVDADTAFMLASVSKVFAASMVAILLDRGLLASLDDNICDALPSTWSRRSCQHPEYPNTSVTWRMLVTHRASLIEEVPSVLIDGFEVEASYGPESFDDLSGNPTCPLDDVKGFYRAILTEGHTTTVGGGGIDWFEEANGGWVAGSEPGSEYLYSNFAFGYIAALAEFKSNMSFEDFSRTYLFEPLGMTRTSWFRENLPPDTKTAIPVESDYENIGHYCFIDYASGQLYSTANDMSKFFASMLKQGVQDNLWSSEVGELLFSCQERDTAGNAPAEECYTGMAWDLLDNSRKRSLRSDNWSESFESFDWTGGAWHDGSEAGVSSHTVILPASDIFISVVTNTDGAAAELLASRVADVITNPTSASNSSGGSLLLLFLSVLGVIGP